MVSDQFPSVPGAISSALAVQPSPTESVIGRDAFNATVAAKSVPDGTEPPVIAPPPEITLFPAGQRTTASLGLIELLMLVIESVWSPVTPAGPVAPMGPVLPVGPCGPVVPCGP